MSRDKATALIHRAKKNDLYDLSDQDLKEDEKIVFEMISQKLAVTLEDVYDMADKNTVMTMNHPLGKKFFIGH